MIKKVIINHINDNKFLYIKVCIFFIVGVCLGVICVNSLTEENLEQSKNYFYNFKENIINIENTEIKTLFLNSFISKIKFVGIIFLLSFTIIGGLFIYFIDLYKGFSVGFVISSLLKTYGIRKGILFAVSTLGFQNIIYIPCIILFSVYCINSCKKIKNRNVDIKIQMLKLSILFIIILIISSISSTIELAISYKIFKKIQVFY